MRIHYIQHEARIGPGCIVSWLEQSGHQISSTHFYESGSSLPQADNIDALIVLGGKMNVYDDALHTWLPAEKALVQTCIAQGKKVLGICLGAQLAAVALGAEVKQAPHRELGWFRVWPQQPTTLPWLDVLLAETPLIFHSHEDQFAIPEGATLVARTAGNEHAAFLYGQHVLGLQFHAEVTRQDITILLDDFGHQEGHGSYVQSRTEILKKPMYMTAANHWMRRLLEGFFGGRNTL
jgi:GMP synthase-like glutamine amidotransferase